MDSLSEIPLPKYPEFKKLSFDDKSWYDNFFRDYPAYADFYFGNAMVWLDMNNDLSLSLLNDCVVYRFTNVLDDNSVTTTLLGQINIDDTLIQLLSDMSSPLAFVPEIVVKNIVSPEKFIIEPEDVSFDHVLGTERLGIMEGPESRKIRRAVHFVEREYGADITTSVEKLSPDHSNVIKELLDSWHKTFTLTTNNEKSHEKIAIARNLEMSEQIDNYFWRFYVSGKCEGFVIFHKPPQQDYIVLNHIKTSYDYKYIFDFMLHQLSVEILKDGVTHINFEQDLGLEGLRQHKLSLKPIETLRKYTIGLK